MGATGRDATATFEKNIPRIAERLREGQYGACASTASELTHFSCLLGDKAWVFASEVLEPVFSNMYHMSRHHNLAGEEEKSIRSKLVGAMDGLLDAITAGDGGRMFAPLAQMRFDTTTFQMNVWTSQPKIQEGGD